MRSAKVSGRQSSPTSANRASLKLRPAAGVRLSEKKAGATRQRLVARASFSREMEELLSLSLHDDSNQ